MVADSPMKSTALTDVGQRGSQVWGTIVDVRRYDGYSGISVSVTRSTVEGIPVDSSREARVSVGSDSPYQPKVGDRVRLTILSGRRGVLVDLDED